MKIIPPIQHKLEYVENEQIRPRFGIAFPEQGIAWVRGDLPKFARLFVSIHELYHLTDESENVLFREVRANLYPFWAIPAGFFWVIFATLISRERMAFYWNLIKRR